MSRRPPLIALAAAIALLAGLASCDASAGEGSRTQQLRAADQTAVISATGKFVSGETVSATIWIGLR